jgi:hypothetical protein
VYQCKGGEAEAQYEPLRRSCPGFGGTGLVILFVVASLGVVFAVFTYYRRKEQVRRGMCTCSSCSCKWPSLPQIQLFLVFLSFLRVGHTDSAHYFLFVPRVRTCVEAI